MDLLLPLLLVLLLVPMFLTMRRQKREMAKTAEMQSALAVGNRVLMTCGIQGIVVEIDDETIDVEIAEDVVTTWSRAAVREVVEVDAYSDDAPADTATDVTDDATPRLTKD